MDPVRQPAEDVRGQGGGLLRFAACYLLANSAFTGSIWILYLAQRGFSLAEIGLAESVFHLAPITLELPSGSLADVAGRKWSLAIGPMLAGVSSLMMLEADSLWWLLPAMYASGASYAFRSGADQAYLYDALAEQSRASHYGAIYGRMLSMSYAILAVSMWAGGVIADRDFRWAFLLAAAAAFIAAGIALTLREPERERKPGAGIAGTIAAAVLVVRQHPGLGWLLAFTTGLATLVTLIVLYAQAVFSGHGLPPSRVSLVIGASLFLTAFGSWISERVGARTGFARFAVAATAAAAAAALGLGGGGVALAVCLYCLQEVVAGIFEPMVSARLNEGLPSAQRATILSIEGFLFSVTMVWAFPLFGAAAERFGWLAAFGTASAVVAALLLGWLANGRATARSRAAA